MKTRIIAATIYISILVSVGFGHTVTYDGNDADSGSAPADQTKTEGVPLTLHMNTGNLQRYGYVFNGWNTQSDGEGTDYAAGGEYTVDAAATLYAKWTESPWMLQDNFENYETGNPLNDYDEWGGSTTYTVASDPAGGANLVMRAAPGNNNQVNTDLVETLLKEKKATVYYRFYIEDTSSRINHQFRLNSHDVFRIKYDSQGFDQDIQLYYDGMSNVTDIEQAIAREVWYHKWVYLNGEEGTYEVYIQGGEYSEPTQLTVEDGEAEKYTYDNSVDLDTLLFRGWDGGPVFYDDFFLCPGRKNLTVPAYTLTYDDNGAESGSVPAAPQSIMISNKVTVLDNTGDLAKDDHVFVGWSTDADEGIGDDYVALDTFLMPKHDVTLYARWAEAAASYEVSYDANGGTGDVPASQNFLPEAQVNVIFDPQPTRADHTFIGWKTNQSATAAEFVDGQVTSFTMPEDNVVLYAHWTEKVTVTLNPTGGSVNPETIIYTPGLDSYGDQGGGLPLPVREGYFFTDWHTASSGGSKVTNATLVEVYSDHTLYAQWSPLLAAYDFTTTDEPDFYQHTFVAERISAGDITAGEGLKGDKLEVGTSSSDWPEAADRPYLRVLGMDDLGTPPEGTDAAYEDASYFSITLTPDEGYILNVDRIYFQLALGSGSIVPRNHALRTSLDEENDLAWNYHQELTTRGTWTYVNEDLSDNELYQGITGPVTFYFIVYRENSSPWTAMEFKNIRFAGSVESTAATGTIFMFR